MLRFVTAGESHGQALVAWISGLPAGVPSIWNLSAANCTGGNWDLGAAAGSESRKIRRIFSRACATGKPSARPSPCASKIATGKIGRRRCLWKIAKARRTRSAA